MDPVEKLQDIFNRVETICFTDEKILSTFAKCLSHYGNFKIQINGTGGNVANVNLQIKLNKDTWLHVSKNNVQPNGSE